MLHIAVPEIPTAKMMEANACKMSDTVKIGKDVYIIERHFAGERDMREAVYAAVKNEAFCVSR